MKFSINIPAHSCTVPAGFIATAHGCIQQGQRAGHARHAEVRLCQARRAIPTHGGTGRGTPYLLGPCLTELSCRNTGDDVTALLRSNFAKP
jgi:hypothetical protein